MKSGRRIGVARITKAPILGFQGSGLRGFGSRVPIRVSISVLGGFLGGMGPESPADFVADCLSYRGFSIQAYNMFLTWGYVGLFGCNIDAGRRSNPIHLRSLYACSTVYQNLNRKP